MCLALPMRIVSIEADTATIAAPGLEQRASLMLVPDARVGDYVLVHAGFAISLLDEGDAQDTLSLIAEIEAFGDDGADGAPDDGLSGDPDKAPDGRA